MKLSSIPVGAPFKFGDRIFYKLYPHFPLGRRFSITYECYEVVKGCLQTPAFHLCEDTEVELYVFNKKE